MELKLIIPIIKDGKDCLDADIVNPEGKLTPREQIEYAADICRRWNITTLTLVVITCSPYMAEALIKCYKEKLGDKVKVTYSNGRNAIASGYDKNKPGFWTEFAEPMQNFKFAFVI